MWIRTLDEIFDVLNCYLTSFISKEIIDFFLEVINSRNIGTTILTTISGF